ncbi:MAG: tRNA uridine-5-carboxymethylaminomethyl(34) synthesis GTPase MnmE [Phreatobacter sp.]|uniref:tRNA uridine-5-carboxymethylaminomethyl(34) synthesis GTPase MnmE n=1 Tax=Phreatobacter sp. TaxID=1966341 RepID=UPI001A42E6C6|nr:tRNA uridine-5-carboxymethylaminomethyl(34) synthesis GTPase MnmE [Phreatobacter sp.]MBL8571777.1 tRNA uridine-5-carboxymethylaminomethyl(34) synthesis GTPase MnmE [Phreatobacter sp.]
MVASSDHTRLGRTIVAVATPPGTSGVAVIRISGPEAANVLKSLANRLPSAREASLVVLTDPASGQPLDRALALWFPTPASFTGEDVVELQVHGGRAVVAAVLGASLAVPGVRPAEPGEFTRRAFENGKLDLAAVEGLGDLLQAETESQRRQAYAQYSGALSGAVATVRDGLVSVLALVEASIDFPDEGDVESGVLAEARQRLRDLDRQIGRLIEDGRRGERIRDGVTIAIAGPPNAGKSTLLNVLARRDAAIVSSIPGTTRDAIEVHLDLGGVAVTLVDTAGLRDSSDPVEQEGIARARRRLEAADLVLWLEADPAAATPEGRAKVWLIRSQIDRAAGGSGARHAISAVTGRGMDAFVADLTAFAADAAGGEPAILVRERHRLAIGEVREHIAAGLTAGDWEANSELIAEQLRLALGALGRLTGRVGSEAILDELFSAFCIGK